MDKYIIKISPKAYREMDGVFAYISSELQSNENAQGQTDRIWKALKKLNTFPQAHQDRTTGRYAGKGYKQLLIDNYIAIFRIDENRKIVTIVTVQFQGRNL